MMYLFCLLWLLPLLVMGGCYITIIIVIWRRSGVSRILILFLLH